MQLFYYYFFSYLLFSFKNFQLDGNQPDVDPENEPDFYEQAPIPA